jgi:parvulin-like peptidyl-prolyl isomerase
MTVSRVRAPSVAALGVTLALVFAACGSSSSEVAARIGDGEVTQEQLATSVGVYKSVFGAEQGACGIADPAAEPDPVACDRAVLGDLILGHIAGEYAVANDIDVPDAEVEDAMAGLEQQYGADQLASAFEENGVTRADLVALVRSSLVQQAVVAAVTEDEIGDDELRGIYEERQGDFSTVEVDHILIPTEEEAQDVYEQATAPGFSRRDFLDLAAEVSTDPGVAENGGTYGPVAATTFDPRFAAGAVALAPGQVSEPVQTDFGWHVIRLESKVVAPFEEVRDQLLQEEGSAVFGTWIRERIEASTVDVNPGLGRWDADTFRVVAIDSTDPSGGTPAAPSAASSG